MSTTNVIALLAAAGNGSRMGAKTSKVLLELSGQSVLQHALQALLASKLFSRIVVLLREDDLATGQAVLTRLSNQHACPIDAVIGARTRQQSVFNGLSYISQNSLLDADSSYVLVHDAARCLVSVDLLRRSVEAAFRLGAVSAALPIVDTLRRVCPDSGRSEPVDRSGVQAIQTPQVFRFDLLLQAHKRARELGIEASDDAALVEPLQQVHLIAGEPTNIKLTSPSDMELAKRLLLSR